MPTPPSKELFTVARGALNATTGPVTVSERSHAIGFASVMRCRHLLAGMVRMHKAREDQASGVLLRTLYETWVRGGYGCLGGDEAYEALQADEEYYRTRLAPELGGGGEKTGAQLHMDEAARRFAVLLRQRLVPAEDAEYPVRGYKYLFKPESFLNAHGGLGALRGYFEDRGGWFEVEEDRPEHTEIGRYRLAMGIAMFISAADVAHHVAELPNLEIGQLGQRVRGWSDVYAAEGPSDA